MDTNVSVRTAEFLVDFDHRIDQDTPNKSLNQALGSHLATTVASRSYSDSYRLSASPLQNGHAGPSQTHATTPTSHSPMLSFVSQTPTSKRKQGDGVIGDQLAKRRREGDENFDSEGVGQGAKHWTDDEKAKLFNWLMAPGQDDHWNALRATKNSCLRDCALEVFDGKKTYQALKGCYERNFNLFKQIYAFEAYHAQLGNPPINSLTESDRLRQFEQRLQAAKKAGCDVGNISARAIDHWHRSGWYQLFYQRWHDDPATTRPPVSRTSISGPAGSAGGDDDGDEDPVADYSAHGAQVNGIQVSPTHQPLPSSSSYVHRPPSPASPLAEPSGSRLHYLQSYIHNSPSDPAMVNLQLTQNMVNSYMQFIQAQSQNAQVKLDYLRRREEREVQDSKLHREADKIRLDREKADWEHTKQMAMVKHKSDLARELISSPTADEGLKVSAVKYLQSLFVD